MTSMPIMEVRFATAVERFTGEQSFQANTTLSSVRDRMTARLTLGPGRAVLPAGSRPAPGLA